MAIDLNAPIGKGSVKSKDRYPSKLTMNLAQKPVEEAKPRTIVLFCILAALVVFVIAKFGVIDQLAAADKAEAKVTSAQSELNALNTQLADYDSVSEEYSLYSYGYQNTQEAVRVDRLDALKLVETYVAPVVTINSITMDENTMTLALSGNSLADTSSLVHTLESLPNVVSVSVYTANTASSSTGITATMTITLQQTEEEAQS